MLLRLEFECPQVKTVCKIALMGLSPFLIIAFDNVLIISLNTVIQMYGGAEADMLLTCTTIVQSFMLIVTMPLGGITSGTGAILAFNFGAGRPDRIRSATEVYHIAGGGAVQHHVPVFTDAGAVFCVSLYAQ